MKKLTILIIVISAIFFSKAQDYEQNKIDNFAIPELKENGEVESPFFKHAFTIPFTSLLDFTTPSVNIGFEQSINKKLGFYFMVGYTNNYINPGYNELSLYNFHGFKVGFEPRIYMARNRTTGIFLTPAFYYKAKFEIHKDEYVIRHNGAYSQAMDYKRMIQAYSFTPKFGLQFLKPNKKVGFEFTAGIGLYFRHAKNIGLPEDALVSSNGDTFPFIQSDFLVFPLPQVTFGLLLAGKQRRY